MIRRIIGDREYEVSGEMDDTTEALDRNVRPGSTAARLIHRSRRRAALQLAELARRRRGDRSGE